MPYFLCRSFLVLAVIACYPVAALYPFHWENPFTKNLVEKLSDGSVRFAGPGIVRSKEPPLWVEQASTSNELQISLTARSFSPHQWGPSRIMTLSLDPWHRNFTIGQEGDDLILRLRTPETDLNGTVNGMPFAEVPDVFRTVDWIDLRFTIRFSRLTIEVNDEVRVEQALPAAPLGLWDPSYNLALGNELTGDRPWLGEIHNAVVNVGQSSVDYTNPAVLEAPPLVRYYHRTPQLIPFHGLKLGDALLNFFGFIPLGLLLGIFPLRRPERNGWTPLFYIFALSTTLEILQYGIPVRVFSLNDIILNCLGGTLGFVLTPWAVARKITSGNHN